MLAIRLLAAVGLAGVLAGPALAQRPKPTTAKKTTQPAGQRRPTSVAAAPVPDDTRQFFHLTPEAAVAGQPFTLSYSPAGTPVAGKAGVRAVVYQFDLDHLRWVAQDVALQPGSTSRELTATYTPPATTGFLAFKFVAPDGSTDNHHDLGYFQMLGDATRPGLPAAGANLGYGLLRKPDFGLGIPDYFKKYTISDLALFLWLSQEVRYHPENAPALMAQFTAGLRAAYPTDYQGRSRRALALARRQPNLTETDLLSIEESYRTLPDAAAQADSVASLLRQRFPQGYLVRREQLKVITNEPDLTKRLTRWQEFLQAYPPAPAYEAPARYAIDYNKVYQDLLLLDMVRQNYAALNTYAPHLSFNGLLTMYYKAVEVSIRPTILSPAQALPYATLLLHRLDSLASHQPAEYAYLSPQEWQAYHAQTTNRTRIHYAGLLTELGRYAEARPYAEAAQRVADYSVADLNDTQAALLRQGGAAEAAPLQKVLEASVHHNQASPRILDWLREGYAATRPGGGGYEQYLAGLQNRASQRAARAELAEKIMKQPIADFALRDLDGRLVRLSEQRGKTVVLDFWATWCVPCKASFPGMKLAQERFSADPNVVFYFIDIEESDPNFKQQVRDFLTTKNFPFRVLLDQNPPGAKTMDATYKTYGKAYHISGIPQKLIIDPKGNLRFITDGYKGSPSALADEIQTMVELARTTN